MKILQLQLMHGNVQHCKNSCLALKQYFILALFLLISLYVQAQPGIHDPSSTVKNTDNRYWHFATGNGIYTISSSTTNFSSWQTENTVFPIGTWPSWIASYVTGFAGNFRAPEVIKMGSTYYCYYSCAVTIMVPRSS